jgi:hypothetical protein
MEWQVVKVSETSGNNVPFVSIGRGQLDFNAVSCELVGDIGQYKYAQLLKGKENGKAVVGVKFLTEFEDNAILIKRKIIDGKQIQGMTVRNKGIIEELFGKDGSNNGMVRHKVELVDGNILKIID